MTYANAIADMKQKVGAAKTSVATAIASLYWSIQQHLSRPPQLTLSFSS